MSVISTAILDYKNWRLNKKALSKSVVLNSDYTRSYGIDWRMIDRLGDEKRTRLKNLYTEDRFQRGSIFNWFNDLEHFRRINDIDKAYTRRILSAIRTIRFSSGNPKAFRVSDTEFWFDVHSKYVAPFDENFKATYILTVPLNDDDKRYFACEKAERCRPHCDYWTIFYSGRTVQGGAIQHIIVAKFCSPIDMVEFKLKYDFVYD